MPSYGQLHAKRRAMLDRATEAGELKVRRHGRLIGLAVLAQRGSGQARWDCYVGADCDRYIGARLSADAAERLIVNYAKARER